MVNNFTHSIDRALMERVFRKIYDIIPPKPAVLLEYVDAETDIYDSKIGGVPYFPKNMPYPSGINNVDSLGGSTKLPMLFVAQLNLDKLPHLEGYPNKGILQFYSSGVKERNYDNINIEFDTDTIINNNEFRVIYHDTITYDREQLLSDNDFFPILNRNDFDYSSGFLVPKSFIVEDTRTIREWYRSRLTWIVNKPYLLKSKGVRNMYPTIDDYRFEPLFLKFYYAEKDYPLETVEEIRYAICDESREINEYGDAYFGGYPYFVNSDPRNYKSYRSYDTLLFEILESCKREIGVEVGSSGTLSYLIPKNKLEERSFSDIMMYGDSL